MNFPPNLELLPGQRFYDRHGVPIRFERFAELKFREVPEAEHTDIVAITHHGDLTISTVWLGWAEGVDSRGRPRIFETAGLGNDGVRIYGRYATEAEAALHHRLVVGHLRAIQPLLALPARVAPRRRAG